MATSKQEKLYNEILEYYNYADKLIEGIDSKNEENSNSGDSTDDEFNPTLAAMESEIKPKVLKTVDTLTKEYNKLIKYQKEKLECILNSTSFSPAKEKSYQKIVKDILENIKSLSLEYL